MAIAKKLNKDIDIVSIYDSENDMSLKDILNDKDDRIAMLVNEYEDGEEEGTEIEVKDAINYYGRVQVKGNTYQKQLSGKNLLDNSTIEVKTLNGITSTYDKDTQEITFNGTCTKDNTLISFVNTNIIASASKTNFCAYCIDGSISGDGRLRFYDANYAKNCILYINELTKGNYTLKQANESYEAVNNNFRFNAGAVCNNFKIKVMVTDSTDTTYEPYCGGQASPNPDYPQNISVVTKENIIKHVDVFNDGKFEIGAYNDLSFQSRARYTNSKIPIGTPITIETNFDLSVYKWAVYESKQPLPVTQQIGTNTGGWHTDTNVINYTTANQYVNLNIARIDDKRITEEEISNFKCNIYSTQKEEYKLDLWNGNEFDINSTAYSTGKYVDKDGNLSSNGEFSVYKNTIKPNTLYKFINSGQSTLPAVAIFDANDNFIEGFSYNTKSILTYKMPLDASYILYSVADNPNSPRYDANIYQIQEAIELYKVGDYKDILFKNVEEDENYNVGLEDGVWYKKSAIAEVVLDGREIWSYNSGNRYFYTNKFLDNYVTQYTKLVSNNYIGGMASNGDLYNNHIQTGTAYSLMLCDNRFTDKNDLKIWLSTHNTIVKYPLATTTYEKITNPTLISQLETLNNKFLLYKRKNRIFTETDNLEPYLKLNYKKSNQISIEEDIEDIKQAIISMGGNI